MRILIGKRLGRFIFLLFCLLSFVWLFGNRLAEQTTQQEMPPVVSGRTLQGVCPFALEFWLGDAIDLSKPYYTFLWSKEGQVIAPSEPLLRTDGGLMTQRQFESLKSCSGGKLTGYIQTDDGSVALFCEQEQTMLYVLDSAMNVNEQMPLDASWADLPVVHMEWDSANVYLFANGPEAETIQIAVIDPAAQTYATQVVHWQQIAGRWAGAYRPNAFVLDPYRLSAYDGVFYLVDSHYGVGDGIERLFFSAYDLQEEQLLANEALAGAELVEMKITSTACYLLTAQREEQALYLTVYDREDLRPMMEKQYVFPAPCLQASVNQACAYAPSLAVISEPYLCVLYSDYHREKEQNLAYLTVYDVTTTDIEYLACIAIDDATTDIRAMKRY